MGDQKVSRSPEEQVSLMEGGKPIQGVAYKGRKEGDVCGCVFH